MNELNYSSLSPSSFLKPPSKALSSILGKSNLQFAGMSINLNISISSLNLMTPDSKQVHSTQQQLSKLKHCPLCVWFKIKKKKKIKPIIKVVMDRIHVNKL